MCWSTADNAIAQRGSAASRRGSSLPFRGDSLGDHLRTYRGVGCAGRCQLKPRGGGVLSRTHNHRCHGANTPPEADTAREVPHAHCAHVCTVCTVCTRHARATHAPRTRHTRATHTRGSHLDEALEVDAARCALLGGEVTLVEVEGQLGGELAQVLGHLQGQANTCMCVCMHIPLNACMQCGWRVECCACAAAASAECGVRSAECTASRAAAALQPCM